MGSLIFTTQGILLDRCPKANKPLPGMEVLNVENVKHAYPAAIGYLTRIGDSCRLWLYAFAPLINGKVG
jgi:hypothetical protein